MMDWLNKEWDFPAHSDCSRDSAIIGTVDECVAQLREHFAVGVQKIIFVPYKYRPDQVETIAREIIPRLKAAVIDAADQERRQRHDRRQPTEEFSTRSTASREHAIGFLQKMVSIPSVTGDEAAIQKFVSDHMKSIGLSVDMWETNWEELKKHPGYRPVDRGYEGRPNIVGTLKGTGGGRSLLLNGHTDVIPVGKGEGWSDDPWSARSRTAASTGAAPAT